MTAATMLTVAIAGGLGAVLRHLVASRFGLAGVLTVNAVGSLLAGAVLALALASALDETARLALATGLAGGLTTFSTISLDAARLLGERRIMLAVGQLLGNLAVGLLATSAGYAVVAGLLS